MARRRRMKSRRRVVRKAKKMRRIAKSRIRRKMNSRIGKRY